MLKTVLHGPIAVERDDGTPMYTADRGVALRPSGAALARSAGRARRLPPGWAVLDGSFGRPLRHLGPGNQLQLTTRFVETRASPCASPSGCRGWRWMRIPWAPASSRAARTATSLEVR